MPTFMAPLAAQGSCMTVLANKEKQKSAWTFRETFYFWMKSQGVAAVSFPFFLPQVQV